ncbi:hypothetical protein VV01_21670 [Luteipulveratus halotolerans]|uniref:Uncharacterized protein n=2 Tax=Luteipulveratus halotolerans TaxID=1631356 RepID=A0A0L6CDB4_9MICO|nr:hypothetical protein VV01_21670 [Luteipulveratus halotolerans]
MSAPESGRLDEARQILLGAGVAEDDIELVVRSRVAGAREAAQQNADRLRDAVRLLGNVGPASGAEVGEGDRAGRGPRITQTDLDGAARVLATATAEQLAAVVEPDVDAIRSSAISGLARCVRTGDQEGLNDRMRFAKQWEAEGRPGERSTS